VLFVQNAIFMLVCLNKFVIYVVSFPIYVNVTHFCFCVWVVCFCCDLGWCGLCSCTAKELLCKMLWMVFSSCRYSSGCRLCVCSLL
jgi:hypothetical protein